MIKEKGKYLAKEIEFNDLVMEWNKKINLVSRKKDDVYDLIDDSRIFLDYMDFTNHIKIMDLGTGGGFPGVIIKIHQPEARLILVDSIMKKVTALCDIVKRLELKNINVICTRAKDMPGNNVFKHTSNPTAGFDYVVARSVASLQQLVKWSQRLLKPMGKLITLKGGDIDEEIKRASQNKFIKKVDVFEAGEKKIVVVGFKK